ncbi:MAG: thiolase family protein [Oligoflexia bacterium]|nr:thiolase family protein [Oligoflexia bacterium]
MKNIREVFIVDANRTPQAKSGMDLKDVPVPYLGVGLIRSMMFKTNIPYDAVDEVIIGNVGCPAKYPNISRVIALEAGLDKKTSGYTVNRNCASGLEAISQGFLKIASERSDIIFCGGVESMSQMPLIFGREMTDLFIMLMKAKSLKDKLAALATFRPKFLKPIVAIEQGLTDPFCNINMGQTAELLSQEFSISREEQDQYANNSHAKAVAAHKDGRFEDEIVPIIVGNKIDRILNRDIGPRSDSSVERLGQMKPYFDKKSGTVTVGNSCPITDGGSMLLLCSQEACERYNLKPIAKIIDYHFHGLGPEYMGVAPALAIYHLLKRTGQKLSDMDLIEINEAFAAQILALKKIIKDESLAKRFDIEAFGEIDETKFNVNGGGIALGHPVGSSGSRIVVTLAHELKRRSARYGLASLCIGGGQGGAIIIENLVR